MEKVNQETRKRITRYIQILFVALAFGLMVIVSYLFVSDIERKNLRNDVKNAIANTEANIKADLLEPETILAGISETIRSMVLLGIDAKTVNSYIQNINNYMQNNEEKRLLGVHGFYGFFEVYGGVFLTGDINWKPPDDYDMENRPFYIAAVEANGDIGVTQPYYNIMAEGEIITFVRRIFNQANQPLGIICLNIFIERVKQHAINTQFAENGYGFLLNQNMELIAHPDPSLLGVRLRNVKSYIAAYEDELMKNGYIYEIITTDYRGIKSIVFLERLYNGWYMGIVTPYDKYYQTTRNMALFLTTLGTALAIILIIILGRVSAEMDKADERMRIMFDSMPLGANLHSRDYRYFDCNAIAVNMFGLSSKQEYFNKFFLLSPEYQPDGELSKIKMVKYLDKAFNEGYCRFEWMHQNINGEPIPCEVTLVRASHQKEFVVAAYIRDLREIKAAIAEIKEATKKQAEAEAQINQSKQSLNILTNILNGIDAQIYAVVPHTGEILFVNDYMKKHFNIKDDCTGKFCYKVFMKDQDKVCDFCPCYKLDKDLNGTVVWEFRDPYTNLIYRNTDRYIEWTDGRTAQIQHSVDITEIIDAKEHAEQSNRFKSQFLSHMSHEIRTPMNAILGITEIQLQNENLMPDMQEALSRIYNSGYLLLGIINDILDLSKIEAGKLELAPVNYDVPSLINDVVHLNIIRFDNKPIVFDLQLDEKIPMTLSGDELRIKQILNNLLSNAFKYTETGKVSLSITVEYGDDPAWVTLVFRVSDTGQGMTREQLDKLFDEYTRFNQEANRTTEGAGLGMNITKRLVSLMNGEISVESELGKGSMFTVRLPQKIVDVGILGKEIVENLMQFRMGKMTQMKKAPQVVREYMPYGKVLIVDDVETNLYVANGLMSPYGLTIDTAGSGFETIEKIKKGETYDIIFMDHFMPKMDGIETTKIIRNLGYTKPVVALTANALTGQTEVFLASGFDGFISKPIDLHQLNAVMNKFIRDMYPAEVVEAARLIKNNMEKSSGQKSTVTPELLKIFTRDAEKAAVVLEMINKKQGNYGDDDIKLYVINVHAMKTALANIGETDLSNLAARLEKAGHEQDNKFISEETPVFLSALRAVVEKNKMIIDNIYKKDADNIQYDDINYLYEKLAVIKNACAEYDKKTAKNTLTNLSKMKWPPSVIELMDKIAEHLLHSELDEAAKLAEDYKNSQN
jgi:signal transduction histidine kinase/CheY-like chemotaxis protein/PAS domain-containing protein